jgi:Tol biopolymer transport system component
MSGVNRAQDKRPTRIEIRAQLETMLADRAFTSADRLSRLLRHLVETAIEGSAADLKEYTVGLDVFDRDPSFDPRSDSVVRVHGSRLRSKLADYYASTGSADPVVIELPKGGYAPVFRYNAARGPESNFITLEPRPETVPARRGFTWNRKKLAAAISGAILLLSIAGAILIYSAYSARKISRQFPLTMRPITSMDGSQRRPSFSPDGSQVVFSWEGENRDNVDLYLTTRDGRALRRITTDPEPDDSPAWSPDGRYIAFRRGPHAVMLVSPLGGVERKIADTDGLFLSWTPDGGAVLIASTQPNEIAPALFAVSIATGEQRRITSSGERPDIFQPFAISPDGKHLAYERRDGPRATSELYVRPLAGGAIRQLTRAGYQIQGWTWAPDSREIVFSSNPAGWYSLWRIGVATQNEDPVSIPDTVDAYNPAMVRAAGTSGHAPDLLAYERRSFHVTLQELDLPQGARTAAVAGPRPILLSTRVDSSPQFSPDGKSIAFVSNRNGFQEIWRSDATGRNPTALTSVGLKGEARGSPRWSPDSSQIVFDARDGLHSNIYVIGSEGGAPRRVTVWPADQVRPRWSTGGQWIYFASTYKEKWGMWKVPATASDTTPDGAIMLTEEKGFEPTESASGQVIYFFRPTVGRVGELFSVPVGGGAATKVMEPRVSHGWWALGHEGIYFVGASADTTTFPLSDIGRPIQFFSFDTHRVTDLAVIRGRVNLTTPDFCISADERRLIYGEADLANTNIILMDPFR